MSDSDSKLVDEEARLAALDRYLVLDTPPEDRFDNITGLVRTVLDVPIATVSLVDRDRQWFKSRPGLDAESTARDISFCTHTIRSRDPMNIPDTHADERFRDNPLVTGGPLIRSYLGVPLTTPDGYNVGALCAIDRRPRDFTPSQIEMLSSFGKIVVDELELRQIAQRDFLTGALTRRAFVAEIERELVRRDRYPGCSALVIFDVDHFKAVNDRFGHPAGDIVLRALAECCGSALRAGDAFGRLGGEEFGLLLPETGPGEALAVADRYRLAIAALDLDVGTALRITASFGVAPLDPDIGDPDAWLAAADGALYAAKAGGRNRCELAEPPRQAAA